MPDQHVFPFCTLCFYVCHVFVFMLSLTYFEKYVQQPEFVVNCVLIDYRFLNKSVEVKEKAIYVAHDVRWL